MCVFDEMSNFYRHLQIDWSTRRPMRTRPCFSCLSQAPRASSTIFTLRVSKAFLGIETNPLSTGAPRSGILRKRVQIARLSRFIRKNQFKCEHMSSQFGTDGTAMSAFVFHIRVSNAFGIALLVEHRSSCFYVSRFPKLPGEKRRLPCFDVHLW